MPAIKKEQELIAEIQVLMGARQRHQEKSISRSRYDGLEAAEVDMDGQEQGGRIDIDDKGSLQQDDTKAQSSGPRKKWREQAQGEDMVTEGLCGHDGSIDDSDSVGEGPYVSTTPGDILRRELAQHCEQWMIQSTIRAKTVRYLTESWRCIAAWFEPWVTPVWKRISPLTKPVVVLYQQQRNQRRSSFLTAAILGILVAFLFRSVIFSFACDVFPENSKYTPKGCYPISSSPQEPLTWALSGTIDTFTSLIDQSNHMCVLPYFIQDSTTAILELRALLRRLDLPLGDTLMAHCNEYFTTATKSIEELYVHLVHLSAPIRQVIATTNTTVMRIHDLYAARETKCNTSPAWAAWVNDKLLAPSFDVSPMCSPVALNEVISPFRNHIRALLPGIRLGISEAIPVRTRFGDLEKLILGIQSKALNHSVDISEQQGDNLRRSSMWQKVWVKLGPAPDKANELQEDLEVLIKVPEYLRDSQKTVSHNIVGLQDIDERLVVLAGRLYDAELNHVAVHPDDLPSYRHLQDLSDRLDRLALSYKVANLKKELEDEQLFNLGSREAMLYDYQVIKAGGVITYGTEE